MRTFIADIIPRLRRYSQQLDNLTLLTNQHWVVVDEISNSKTVYIFRANSELLISQNGKVERARWEYLGHNSLLIDINDQCYLYKHGFFDENILALKVDSKEEYAFLINETKFEGELNSIERILDFLNKKYIEPEEKIKIQVVTGIPVPEPPIIVPPEFKQATYNTKHGQLTLIGDRLTNNKKVIKVELNGEIPPDGKYKIGFMWYVNVANGFVTETTFY